MASDSHCSSIIIYISHQPNQIDPVRYTNANTLTINSAWIIFDTAGDSTECIILNVQFGNRTRTKWVNCRHDNLRKMKKCMHEAKMYFH